MLDYSDFFQMLSDKNISQYYLLQNNILTHKQLDDMKHGRANLTCLTLEKLCTALHCTPNDIVSFK